MERKRRFEAKGHVSDSDSDVCASPSPVLEIVKSGASLILYSVTSIATVFLNRRLFTRHFRHPLVVTWIQQLITLGLLEVFALSTVIVGPLSRKPRRLSLTAQYRLMDVRLTPKRLVPLCFPALSFMGMIVFSNLCLKYAPVSTYQVARSTTIVFNLMLSSWLVAEPLTTSSVIACLITGCGFLIGTLDPSTLSWKSCMTGVLGSFFQALHSVSLKAVYKAENHVTQAQVLYGVAFISSVFCLPVLWITGELRFVKLLWPFGGNDPSVLGYAMLSGLSGVFVTVSASLAVRLTSPVTYCITGYAKAAAQSFGGLFFLQERYSAASLTGITATLLGCSFYSWSKLTPNTRTKA